jgi:hypothetical protein
MSLGEKIAWIVDFAETNTAGTWTPTSVISVTAYDASGTDVTSTTMSGSSSISGTAVTLPLFTPASAQTYRMVCIATATDNNRIGAILEIIVRTAVPTLYTPTNGYATVAEFKQRFFPNNSSDTVLDQVISSIIEAVSREVDNHTRRRFYTTTSDETRYYTSRSDALCYTDDIISVTTFATDNDGDRVYENTWTTADYDLMPANAALDSQPYTWVAIAPGGDYTFPDYAKGVKIVGKFGYCAVANIPKTVKEACLLQCYRLYKRMDAPFGIVGSAEMGQAQYIARLDPDVKMMLSYYVRPLVY